MNNYIKLANQYKEQATEEMVVTLLDTVTQALTNGQMPDDVRVKFSLILGKENLMDETTDFTDLTLVKEVKCKEIDSSTADSIITLAGDEVKQRNLTAKSVSLTLKVAQGTITPEEQTELDGLVSLFSQIGSLRTVGNDKETQINACTTQEEFDAKCTELGV